MQERKLKFSILAAMVLSGVLATPVLAQAEVCVDPNTGAVDGAATRTWQQMSERSDPELMRQMAGTWYIEIPNPYNSQVDQEYLRYSSDGFFDYRSHVCDTATGGCNDYSGQGNYAVIGLPDGSLQFMSIVSDLNRDRQCSGSSARFVDTNSLRFSTGGIMRRVR
jgi:hypothetical protein